MNCIYSALLYAFTLLIAAHPSMATAAPNTYAVISLIGDKLEIVTHVMSTGSSLDHNNRQSLPVAGGVYDKAAMAAAKTALSDVDSSARVALYEISAPTMFDHQDRFFDGARVKLPEAIVAALRGDNVTQLVLITKHRAEANLRVGDETHGNGRIEGLGFYLDPIAAVKHFDSGETNDGFIAPYFYAKVSLIDIATQTVLRESTIRSNRAATSRGRTSSLNAWDALTPAQKIQALQELIESEVPKAVQEIAGKN